MKPLLALGLNERWWCPNCGQVKHKAQFVTEDGRFHSWMCKKPMERVRVLVEVQP